MEKLRINFSHNWNRKLHCDYFTTIRRASTYYQTGQKYEIYLQNNHMLTAQLIEKRTIKFADINEFIACLDGGYRLEEFRGILMKMYKNIDLKEQLFFMMLFEVMLPENPNQKNYESRDH